MSHRVAVIVADGVNPFELTAASEVFGPRRNNPEDPRYEFGVCSPAGQPVTLANGLDLSTHHDYTWAESASTVIVPAWPREGQAVDSAVVGFLRHVDPQVTRIVSFCSGAFLLAEAGLLDGRRATAHWMHTQVLRTDYPLVQVEQDQLYTEDNNVYTSAGSSAALDLSLFLVAKDWGANAAAELARRLVLAPHRSGGQNQFAATGVTRIDDLNPVADATSWALSNLHQTIRVRDIASKANMSERTFSRHFLNATGMSPISWLQQQRVELAKQLLEVSDRTIPRVASDVGLGSAANLRQHFSRHVGVSPTSYRRSFSHKPR